MKDPKDIVFVEDLVGYMVVAGNTLGPIVIWDGKFSLSLMDVHSQGAKMSHIETRELAMSVAAHAWLRKTDADNWLHEYEERKNN